NTHALRITGIPIDAKLIDIKNIINKVNGKTCTIFPAHPNEVTKSAITFIHPENYNKSYRKFNTLNSKIYIFPAEERYYCTSCGDFNHIFKDCNYNNPNGHPPHTKVFLNRQDKFLTQEDHDEFLKKY